MKKMIKRIFAKTPKRDKLIGKICSLIGMTCTAIMATGSIVNVTAIVLLTISATVFSSKALYHAQKTEE
jgi:hypothetical protein